VVIFKVDRFNVHYFIQKYIFNNKNIYFYLLQKDDKNDDAFAQEKVCGHNGDEAQTQIIIVIKRLQRQITIVINHSHTQPAWMGPVLVLAVWTSFLLCACV